MKSHASLAVIALALPLLAGCGTTTEDRTLGGAALGAGFGALLGIGIGGISVLPGAAIGAVAGATTGAFTEPDRIDYGRPVWRQEIIREGLASAGAAIADAAEDGAEGSVEAAPPEPRPLTEGQPGSRN